MVGGPSEVYASSGAAVFCAGMNPLSLKDLLKGCLLVAFFENLPVLLLLIKRAALGIVQANLTLLSFAQPFPSGDKGCANRPFNSLYDPFGSPCRGQKRCSNRYAIWLADHQRFFRKPTSPPLSLREGPPLSPSPFPLRVQGMYQPPYSVLKPLCYKVGGPSEVYASFLCGMGPQGEDLLKNGCVGWDCRQDGWRIA